MEIGKGVGVAEISAVLGDRHLQMFCMRRDHLKAQRQELKEAREAFSSYTNLLRIADLRAARNESINNRRSARGLPARPNIDSEAESEYEHAIERLDEIISSDPSLTRFLDRDWTLHESAGRCDIAPSKLAVPRLRFYKKNVYGNAKDNVYLDNLYDIKVQVLNDAIANPQLHIENEKSDPEAENRARKRLSELLKGVDDEDEFT